ncbi:MAG: carboxy terminal-processing peptidase [Agriterribacter sp.]
MRNFFLCFVMLIFSCRISAQSPLEQQVVLLTRVIQLNHYNPRQIDDSFSSQVFDRMLKELDAEHLYFTQKDIKELELFRNSLDEEMRGNIKAFFTAKLGAKYKERLQKAIAVLNTVAQKPFTFDISENISNSKQQLFPTDDAAFEKRLYAYYKMQTLSEIISMAEQGSIVPDKSFITKTEPAARKKIITNEKNDLEEILNNPDFQQQINDTYLETIASNFDPHTNFFEPEENESFKEHLSSEAYKYGFSFEKDEKSKYKITLLTPGGAAWKSGSIHKDDEIISIQPDNDSTIYMDNANAESALSALDNPSNKTIKITVKSADGFVKTVVLQKQKQHNDENTVRGFVLTGSSKTGYIYLPSFYTEWENDGSSSCANDVAKEIVKLKKDGIEGLILDLRYNGGGSLQEAMELIGIFIDVGPGCIIKYKDGKAFILKDPNRGTMYDGPLVVMINGQSASASELVAGTLQDYQRALIVGSNSFGKATMQSVLPLDTLAADPRVESRLAKMYGYAKVTGGKLFRITGKSAQLNGVNPDIVLADAFEINEYTERSLDNALSSDTIMKNVMYTKLPGYKIPALSSNSKARIARDKYFTSLIQLIQTLKASRKNNIVPLKWDEYLQWNKQQQYQRIPASYREHHSFEIKNSSFDNNVIKLDDYYAQVNEYVKNEIALDKYIEEAYHILNDIIKTP